MEQALMAEELYELQQRLNWFIHGIGRHGLSWTHFQFITADWIVKNYNVEWSHFKK